MNARTTRRLAVGAVVAVTVGAAVAFVEPRRVLRAAVRASASELFLLVLLAVYLARPVLAMPMSLITVVVGWRYGVGLGFFIAIAGTAITTYPPYYFGRYYRTDDGVFGWLSRTGERAFDTTGDLRGMIGARLSPAPADPVSYGAGLSGVTSGTYVLGTVLGEIPWTIGYLLVGRSMQELSLDTAGVDYRVLLGFGVLAVLIVLPPLVRAVRTE